MMYFQQLNKHDPDNGTVGDCYRTCIGCILNINPVMVPNFAEHENWQQVLENWLNQNNIFQLSIPVSEFATFEEVLDFSRRIQPNLECIIIGKSPRNIYHAVVARDGKLIHNPSVHGEHLIPPGDYWWIEYLVSPTPFINIPSI